MQNCVFIIIFSIYQPRSVNSYAKEIYAVSLKKIENHIGPYVITQSRLVLNDTKSRKTIFDGGISKYCLMKRRA